MKTVKRLDLIRFLMIVSQLALTVFVGQWLWTVYLKERDRFDQDLSRKFRESEMTVIDSMLMVKVLDPMMRDSSYRRMTMNITLDSQDVEGGSWQGKRIYKNIPSDSCKKIIAITASDSIPFPPVADTSGYLTFNSSDAIFLQGMKLVVRRIEDSLFLSNDYRQGRVILKDTVRIKELFTGNTRKIAPSLQIVWTTDEPPWDTMRLKGEKFYYEMPAEGYILAATIRNPLRIILNGIYPSILFAFSLLVLTGLSFVFAFRSLKSQIQLNHLRTDFMSNITHELKTPVSTVKVALEALKKFSTNNDPAVTSDYLEMASREMDRLDHLISRVLQSSMYENGIRFIEKEELDLGMIGSDVMEILQPKLLKHGARITMEEQDGPCIVYADRMHLQGVLINLIENSLNYCGDKPEILISLVRTESEVTVSVADNGPGIPEEYLDKVFDKFFRVPHGDRHNVKGYGLGLSYASKVMKLHGGKIRAENIQEGGVRFILEFPQKTG